MEWEYKKIKITIQSDGKFYFTIRKRPEIRCTLEDAKHAIDIALEDYYTFKAKDIDSLCVKLNVREAEFVRALIKEINYHASCSSYCEIGISDEMLFKF